MREAKTKLPGETWPVADARVRRELGITEDEAPASPAPTEPTTRVDLVNVLAAASGLGTFSDQMNELLYGRYADAVLEWMESR